MNENYEANLESGAVKRSKTNASGGSGKKRSTKKKKTSGFSRAMKKIGRKLYNALERLEKWTTASRRNKIITLASVVVVGLLLVGGVVLSVLKKANAKPTIEMTLVEEDVAENYTFVDESEYAGTLLEKTADAGVSYIEDTLFVGDSNMARLVMYGLLDYSNVIGVESMGIQGVTGTPAVYFSGYSEPVTVVKAISLMKPRRIIFNFGTNNLLGSDTSDFIDSYDYALKKIKEAYPYCDIILMAIHPLGQNRSNTSLTQKQVDNYNLALIKYAKSAGYPYLDTAEVLKGEDGWLKEKFAYTDGVHLTKEGLNAVLSYARTHSRIVEDARPQPIGSTPTQVAPPVKETEKEFDPASAASAAQTLFISGGFTTASGHSGTPQVSWNWGWPIEGAKGGTESNVAQSLYSAYLAQNSVKTGAVIVSYTKSSSEYVFTVSVYATVTHTHTYAWVATSGTLHTGTCSDASCTASDKVITHAPTWGAWASDGTNCSRGCTGFAGCTVKETHASAFGAEIVDTAATTAAEGKAHKVCATCGAIYNYTLPKIAAHTHAYGAWAASGETHTRTCTASGCTNPPASESHAAAWGAAANTPPTCTEAGYNTFTCTVCGLTKTESDGTAALGHSWGEWVVVTPAGPGVPGSETRTCSVCGAVETREIPAQ